MSDNIKNNLKYPANLPIPRKAWWQRLIALGIIIGVLLLGFSINRYLMDTRPQAKRKPPVKMQTLVETISVTPITTNVTIKALGIVTPDQEVNLQARVSGVVTFLHPSFEPGSMIKKGEVIIRIDDTDYKLNLKQKTNQLAQARADLRLEEGNQIVARQEWQLISDEGIDIGEANIDLAMRKPHLDKVMANINVAETAIEQAKIDLARTEITAPFNCVIRQKNVSIGSQISSQSSIALLTGTDTFRAEVSIPVNKLKWLILPDQKREGSRVNLYANGNTRFQGSILKLLADLDPDGLMARLLISIPDPMGMKNHKIPLFLGSFIRAEIEGRELKNVFRIPRSALVDEDKVLIVSPENTLHIQPVSVAWKNTEFVFVDKGLTDNNRIIVSTVGAPIEGMELEIRTDQTQEQIDTKRSGRNE